MKKRKKKKKKNKNKKKINNESNKNKVIDISNFSSGLYFVVVSIEGNVSSEKIVKN